ncbi:hypothetical protein OFN33_32285, partial [Escherichia coli]|nr:hypothetical protein [Escherichia coli]
PKDVVGIVRSLVTDRSRYAAMRAATAGLTIPNSTEYIVREILTLLPQEIQTMERESVTVA